MEFRNVARPRTSEEWLAVRQRWDSLGWRRIQPADEPALRTAWEKHLEYEGKRYLPRPIRVWNLRPLISSSTADRESVETDVTLKILAAFRRIVPLGSSVFAIDWQHDWYEFDPLGGVSNATRDEWAMPILPDGDIYHFIAPDFRCGAIGDCMKHTLTLFGRDLLNAFDADPPRMFLNVCPIRHRIN